MKHRKEESVDEEIKVKKKHVKKESRVKEIQVNKDYKGEASPYWEHLDNSVHRKGAIPADGDLEFREPEQANPDKVAESEGLYYHEPFIDEDKLEQVRQAIPFLTKKQRMVLQMVGLEGKTMENCGALMGISRGNVADLLQRARKIIMQKSKNI